MHVKLALIEDNNNFSPTLKELLIGEEDIHFSTVLDRKTMSLDTLPILEGIDLVLLDIELNDYNSIALLSKLKKQFPFVNYLILTHYDSDEKLFETLHSGATGYVLKNEHPELIIENIRGALLGKAPMSMDIAKKVLKFFHHLHKVNEPHSPLSEKEQEIISLLSTGKLYKEIADELGISIDTVKKHCGTIYRKLHVQNRTEAINAFFNH